MKSLHTWAAAALLIAASVQSLAQTSAAQTRAFVQKLVQQCAAVKEGDVVAISGRREDAVLLEDIAVEVRKRGAFPLLLLTSDRLNEQLYRQVPAKYDAVPDLAGLRMVDMIDVMISVDSGEREAWTLTVPPDRASKRAEAGVPISDAMLKKGVRIVSVGNGMNPTMTRVRDSGLSRAALTRIYWNGINTEYNAMQRRARGLQSRLESGRTLRITSPNGTNLTLDIGGQTASTSDGVIDAEDVAKGGAACQVWLPAGEVFMATVPGSARGVLVANPFIYRGRKVSGLRLNIRDGRVVSMSGGGAAGDAFRKYYASFGAGKEEVSLVDFGINPNVSVPAGTAMSNWVQAGMVTVGIGGNTWVGGSNKSPFGEAFHVYKATVTLDGQPLVTGGRLR